MQPIKLVRKKDINSPHLVKSFSGDKIEIVENLLTSNKRVINFGQAQNLYYITFSFIGSSAHTESTPNSKKKDLKRNVCLFV